MAHEQRRVHFSGRVQGVGFRYTTCQVASRFNVTGYVQNLPDGRVLLVAEGEAEEVDQFLAAVEERLQSYVTELKTDTRPATGEFSGFDVRY